MAFPTRLWYHILCYLAFACVAWEYIILVHNLNSKIVMDWKRCFIKFSQSLLNIFAVFQSVFAVAEAVPHFLRIQVTLQTQIEAASVASHLWCRSIGILFMAAGTAEQCEVWGRNSRNVGCDENKAVLQRTVFENRNVCRLHCSDLFYVCVMRILNVKILYENANKSYIK